MLMIKLIVAIVIAYFVMIALGIVVFFISKVVTCGMDEYKERRNKNGKQN